MNRPSVITPKERNILLLCLGGAALAFLLYFGLGIFVSRKPVLAVPSGPAEIAVLCPASGGQAELCQGVQDVIRRTVENNPYDDIEIIVTAYDSGQSPDDTASAAARAAQNPNTVAIIGPLDARQVAAAADSASPYNLIVVSPSSTASTLNVPAFSNLYRIPAPDDLQGAAIVDVLTRNGTTDVFVIAEEIEFIPPILASFNTASQNRLRVVGNLLLTDAASISDAANQVQASQAQAVVILGSASAAKAIVEGMAAISLHIPVIGTDALNTNAILPLPGSSEIPVLYTSPMLILPAAQDYSTNEYRQLLGDLSGKPFAYESAQAALMVISVLSVHMQSGTPRQAVYDFLPQIQVSGYGGYAYTFNQGQVTPQVIHVYIIDPQASDWLLNPIVYSARLP